MGDRVSIQFKDSHGVSPVLFSHWGGKGFVKDVKAYLKTLNTSISTAPLNRLEHGTVMMDFIRHITKDMSIVDSDYYLELTVNDGDNSDNGHYIFDLDSGKVKHTKGEYE